MQLMNLIILVELISGDYWYIKVYQDIPTEVEFHYILTGVMALVSLIVMIGGLYVEDKASAYVEGRTDAQRNETYYT